MMIILTEVSKTGQKGVESKNLSSILEHIQYEMSWAHWRMMPSWLLQMLAMNSRDRQKPELYV